MDHQGHVVIVDAYAPSRRLAPEFVKAGFACVRLQSTPEVPPVYRSAPPPLDDFVANLVHTGDLEATTAAVAAYRPVAVLTGGELGVMLADAVSERLGLATNGTALSEARRDKFTMIETIRRAGLGAARQIRVRDAAELAAWHREIGGRVVVKPSRSAGGDRVSFCSTPEESARAFTAMAGSRDIFSAVNETAVAQEYLPGTEYMVNTVSRAGRHHVCDIWRTTRVSANGLVDLCDALHLVPCEGEVAAQLTGYTHQVLDALGVRYGPAHVEVRMTPAGPRLVELGARMPGGDIPYYASLGIGESQLDWTVDAYVRPDRFDARRRDPYRLRRYCAMVAMISPFEGTLRGYRDLPGIEALESFHQLLTLVQPGQPLRRTVDDLSYPLIVTLVHELAEVVARDHGTIRYLDGHGFYQLG
ncbi:MAG: ATP-grasp domain-containing protein [Mycobacteriales bacterium]